MTAHLAKLPAREPPPKQHSWPREAKEPVPAWGYPDGHARHFRICADCSLAKITVHAASGRVWREWQHPNGKVWVGGATPPCLPQNKAEDESAR